MQRVCSSSATAWRPAAARGAGRARARALRHRPSSARSRSPAYNRVLLSSAAGGRAGGCRHRAAARRLVRGERHHAASPVSAVVGAASPSAATRSCWRRRAAGVRPSACWRPGSEPIRLPLPGSHLAGVTTFRDLARCSQPCAPLPRPAPRRRHRRRLARASRRPTASRARGAKVTLVHLMDRLMERQLDAAAARCCKRAMEAKGIRCCSRRRPRRSTAAAACRARRAEGRPHAPRRARRHGRRHQAARRAGGERAGLTIGRGIKVDDKLETSRPRRLRASASAPSTAAQCYGLVEPAYEQAQGAGAPPRRPARPLRGLAAGHQPQGLGRARVLDRRLRGRGRRDHRCWRTGGAGIYRKLVLRDDRLCRRRADRRYGARRVWYRELVRQQVSVAPIRGALAFGKAYAEAA